MRRALVYPYVVWIALFTVIPLLLIFYYSLNVSADGGTIAGLDNFRRIFASPIYLDVIWRSIKLAFICTAICFVLGYPVGYILASKEYNTRNTLIFLFIIPMWMNVLLRTYAWLTILENNGILNAILNFLRLPPQAVLYTDTAVILGMVYNFVPFMILPIYTVLKRMDTRLIEAAQDLGANNRKVFFRVMFPLSVPGVISGVTMVFMPAVTTFVISNLLGGGQFLLIGNLIEQQFLRAHNWGFGSALSVVLIVTVLISIGVISLVDKDLGGQGGRLI
jgi:spermidine/putrescine transport system permease protein